jgi:hypothetical protein
MIYRTDHIPGRGVPIEEPATPEQAQRAANEAEVQRLTTARRIESQLNNTRTKVLQLADKAVNGERQLNYGSPESNFHTIASLWEVYRDHRPNGDAPFTPADVAIMLALVKIARLTTTPNHFDSWVDIAGYAACGAEVSHAQPQPPTKD